MPSFSGFIRCCALPVALLAAAATTGAQARLNGPATIKLDEIPWPTAQAGGAGTSGASGIQTVVMLLPSPACRCSPSPACGRGLG